jgi:hypothetical protein
MKDFCEMKSAEMSGYDGPVFGYSMQVVSRRSGRTLPFDGEHTTSQGCDEVIAAIIEKHGPVKSNVRRWRKASPHAQRVCDLCDGSGYITNAWQTLNCWQCNQAL